MVMRRYPNYKGMEVCVCGGREASPSKAYINGWKQDFNYPFPLRGSALLSKIVWRLDRVK